MLQYSTLPQKSEHLFFCEFPSNMLLGHGQISELILPCRLNSTSAWQINETCSAMSSLFDLGMAD